MPTAMGGSKDMSMTVTLSGPVWIVKDAPGAAEYTAFYKAAAEKGWIFGDPRAAKAQAGQAKAMAEMYRKFAEIGGIAYESDIQMKMGMQGGGGGPLAGMLAKMGNVSMQTKVEDVQTGPVADDLFAPPAGYKLNNRK
jgi:threonine dehydratase